MASLNHHDSATGILDLCRRLVSIILSASKTTEREIGLSTAQFFVLQKLSDGRARSVNELAELTRTHQSSVSVVIKKLVAKGMIISAQAEDDARKLALSLSAKGHSVLHSSNAEAVQDRLLRAIGILSNEEANELRRLLQIVVDELKPAAQAPPLFLEDE
jgi:DNA-binding MarR family transcriptional regulator